MIKLKQNKGITLIALIITIIVMLILVGVTINVALNGGLFGKAETATRETEEKAILEEMLAMMEIDDNGKIKPDEIIANMRTKHPDYEIIYNKPNATITGKLGEYNYIVSEEEIKIGSKEIKPFDWEDVGLTVDTDTDTDYKFYDTRFSTTYVINFTADGELIVKADGTTVETYDAKDNKNINEDGYLTISFTYAGTAYDTTLTMNSNNVDVDAELKDFATVTYIKVEEKTYPVAYGDYNSFIILQISDTEAILGIMGTYSKNKIIVCNDVTKIEGYETCTVINEGDISYSKALKNSEGKLSMLYSESLDAWAVTSHYQNTGTGTNNFTIYAPNIELNTTITQDQIDSIIQAANAINE